MALIEKNSKWSEQRSKRCAQINLDPKKREMGEKIFERLKANNQSNQELIQKCHK